MTGRWGAARVRWGIALALVVASALPRAYRLGDESLAGDEDFTWLAATAVAEGRGSVMPSGMPYRRALPFTWANAAVVSVVGADDNLSVRVVAAAAGSVTPGVVFVAGSRLVAPPVALVGAVLLSVSEWHVARSRHGRMYPLLALVFFLTGIVGWLWAREGGVRRGVLAVALLGATVSLHLLGLPAAQTALLAIALPGSIALSPWLIAGVVAASTWVFFRLNQAFVQAPYGEWGLPPGFLLVEGTAVPESGSAVVAGPGPSALLIAVGIALGLWWAVRAPGPRLPGVRGRIEGAIQALGFVAVSIAVVHGFLMGAALAAVVVLLFSPRSTGRLSGGERLPVALLFVIACAWLVYAVGTAGPEAGLRRLVGVPYLYLRSLWTVSPGLVFLFTVGTAGLCVARREASSGSGDGPGVDRAGLRAAALSAWIPLVGLGFATPHGPARYAFMLLPFMVLVAAWPLVAVAEAVVRQGWGGGVERRAAVAAAALVLLGVVPGHGLASVWRGARVDYGTTVDPVPVDHETPGRHLARVLRPGDVVIAEDETMARVYAGQVDYWFRRAADARAFLYLAEDGEPRSKYTGAGLVSSPAQIDEVLRSAGGTVWLLTSREAWLAPRFYHSPEQGAWLARLRAEHEPAVVGRDGVSALYCLNCRAASRVANQVARRSATKAWPAGVRWYSSAMK